MKAYRIMDRKHYNPYTCVVFAENRGKAISAALGTDEFPKDAWFFTELCAIRLPQLDKEYRGHSYMDWYNDADRIALVRYAGYICEYPDAENDCKSCAAKQYCEAYLEEDKENGLQNWNAL